MAIGMTELISKVGDDRIKFQTLDSDAISMKYDHKKGTVITFGTDMPLNLDGTKEMGLVVWLPREVVSDILGNHKG